MVKASASGIGMTGLTGARQWPQLRRTGRTSSKPRSSPAGDDLEEVAERVRQRQQAAETRTERDKER